MSRIGKQPVVIPSGVKVSQAKDGDFSRVSVEGPKGKLSFPFRHEVAIEIDGSQIRVKRTGEEAFHRAYHGTVRSLLASMVLGVSQGFERGLEIEGVGYNAKLDGKSKLIFQIGFCHPVTMMVPAGLTVELPKPTVMVIKGADKQMVGEFAARIRKIRPPEPYKGKGIRYAGEKIVRKTGKAYGSAE